MDELLGTISKFAFNWSPNGWIVCHGQLMIIGANQALFSLLGNTYGGDGVTSFAVPDLREKDKSGNYYTTGQIMENGLPYIESYICIQGLYPQR